MTDNIIIIGFDSEWVARDEKSNHVLSYQYAVKVGAAMHRGIVYTEGAERKHRWKLSSLMGHAIEEARTAGVIGRVWPTRVFACAHFTRADLGSFRDYPDLKTEFDSLRGSYSTITRPYNCTFYDKSRNVRELEIHLRDSMVLSPGGTSLAALGELHDLPKIELPRGAIAKMDQLLKDDPGLFERYAIRDAEIAALHVGDMTEFARREGTGDGPPLTIGSIATAYVENLWRERSISRLDVLGKEAIRSSNWKNGRTITKTREVYKPSVADWESLATEAYHGGRNEAYIFGLTKDDFWTDLDLVGAYSTAMAAIKMPDWENIYTTTDLKEFTCDRLGLARVIFKFPDTVRYPCLPVRTNHGLIFPLEGETYCGSPEIQLAFDLGASITIENGIIVPWLSDIRPFEVFSSAVRANREDLDEGSVFERTWKEIGNSVYGKIAQGLKEKRVYDTRIDASQILPESRISQPFLAAYITSIVRATLGEILSRIPAGKQVVSATTDGFISNAVRKEIDQSGPLCSFFAEQAQRLTGNPTILKVKHVVPQVLCMKTRGQLTVGLLYGSDVLQAKAGAQVHQDVIDKAFRRWENLPEVAVPEQIKELAENDWLLEVFFNRTNETRIPSWAFASMRKMATYGYDLIREETEKRINLDFDWKRELSSPENQMAGQVLAGQNPWHLSLSSTPIKNINTFHNVRRLFDQWRQNKPGVLKTEADWLDWCAYRKHGELRSEGVITGRGSLVEQAKREFLRQYSNQEAGYSGKGYRRLAEWLTKNGYKTTVDAIKNAKRVKPSTYDWNASDDSAV